MESLKDWYRGGDPKKPVNKLVTGAFGAVAGAASVFGNTPVDVVKTRMQVSLLSLFYIYFLFFAYYFLIIFLQSLFF